MKRLSSLLLLLFSCCLVVVAQAEELSAEAIVRKITVGRGFTWAGAKTRLRMVLEDKGGGRKERVLDVLGRTHNGHSQSVVRFREPADVAGTAFLMLERDGGKAEQHIYLPGLRRTRRIVGRETEGSFMGSDFTYADLRPVGADEADHKRLPDEKLGKEEVFVIESKPHKSADVSYAKVVTWVRKSDYVPLRTRFYGSNGKLAKTLYARRIKEVEGKPVIVEARMEAENGHSTVLIVESLERQVKLPDSAFTPGALEH